MSIEPPPDDADWWSLSATPIGDGVRIAIAVAPLGITTAVKISRAEARSFARAVLAAAGDAAERTFPHPPIPETAHG